MSMNLFQKIVTVTTITGSVLFMGSMYFKDTKTQKHDSFKVRQQLLKEDKVKMLYSTLSFFYLQGFQQKSLQSFYTMKKILQIEKPHLIALPISFEEYEENYVKVMRHPKYQQAMDKFQHHLKTQNTQEILKMTDLDLGNLEKLYLIDYCKKMKKCKLVFCRKPKQYYVKLQQSYQKLKQQQNITLKGIDQVKVQDYAEALIQQMKPKFTLSILPQSPYKVIFGIIQPNLIKQEAAKWKQKFQQAYKHQVIEDEQVLERQKINKQARSQSRY